MLKYLECDKDKLVLSIQTSIGLDEKVFRHLLKC